ncbi:MAG: hypothetical protein ACSHXD_09180 [Marinosulfonomonas sp.]
MTKIVFVAGAALALAGCGADGSPERPSKPGITVTGETTIGVVSQ